MEMLKENDAVSPRTTMRLLYFEHCSLCFRIRMVAALKGSPLEEEVVMDDDSESMVQLVGRRVIPILVKDNGEPMLESMDIVDYLDSIGPPLLTGPERSIITRLSDDLVERTPPVTMPIYATLDLPEFATASARAHFIARKEQRMGSLDALRARRAEFVEDIEKSLKHLEPEIDSPMAINGSLSRDDVRVLPLLRSAAVIEELAFPPRLDAYFRAMMERTGYPPLSQG